MKRESLKKQHVSMQDVADAAGVSKATVSKVLNNRTDVSERVKRKVSTVCEKLGYRLNPNIQDLLKRGVTGHSQDIAFVLVSATFADPTYSGMTEGISLASEIHNLHLILSRLSGDEKSIYDLPPVLRDRRVGGVLLSGSINESVIALLRELDLPYVIIGNYGHAVTADANCVESNTGKVMFGFIKELKRRQKTRIALFHEDPANFHSKTCFEAFKSALAENQLPFDPGLVYVGRGGYYNAFEVMGPELEKEPLPFDSIICPNFFAGQEVACLLVAHYGKRVADEVIICTSESFVKKLPIPGLYSENITSKLTVAGLDLLIEQFKRKTSENKSISFTPRIFSDLPPIQ